MNNPHDHSQDNTNEPTLSEKAKRLIAAFQDAKGQYIQVRWFSEPTANAKSKKAGVMLRKTTTAVVRTGVAYENLKVVKDAIAAGEREEVGSLPFGKWLAYPYIITHEGREYLRLTMGANTRPTCEYEVNGVKVDRDTFLSHLPPSASKEKPPALVISIKLESLLSIGE